MTRLRLLLATAVFLRWPAAVVVVPVLLSCGEGTGPGSGRRIEIVVQPPATVVSGTSVSPAAEIRLIDDDGDPVGAGLPVIATELALAAGDTLEVNNYFLATDDQGHAVLDNLVLGPIGEYVWRFSTPEGAPDPYAPVHTRISTVLPGTPDGIVVLSPDNLPGVVGEVVAPSPAVRVVDWYGNAVGSGVRVRFTPNLGVGYVAGGDQVTDEDGVATVGAWTLGGQPGYYSLSVTLPDYPNELAGISALASGTVTSRFSISLVYLTGATPAQQAAFDAAKARWEEVIFGDLEDVTIVRQFTTSDCGAGVSQPVSGTVDDIRIYVELRPIDGVGNVIGSAGPCDLRPTGTQLPYVGIMYFDTADIAQLEAAGALKDVILHEMGHVLGYGTLWEAVPPFWPLTWLAGGCPGGSPEFTGPRGVTAYTQLNGGGGASGVPVENTGTCSGSDGDGTRDSHWRESILRSEVMTGFISGTVRALSATSVRSIADLGYFVDDTKADAFHLSTQPTVELPARAPTALIRDVIPLPRWTVDPAGRRKTQYSKP